MLFAAAAYYAELRFSLFTLYARYYAMRVPLLMLLPNTLRRY